MRISGVSPIDRKPTTHKTQATKTRYEDSMAYSGNRVVLWSGESSGKGALALSRFLKLTLNACDPWMSAQSIDLGSFWHEELWKALRTAKIGIICLTPENVNSKWIHFEAGVVAKTFGRVFTCPYLVNLHPAQVEGPLQHLQSISPDKEGTFRLVQEINKRLRIGRLESDILFDSFTAHWRALKGYFGQNRRRRDKPKSDARGTTAY